MPPDVLPRPTNLSRRRVVVRVILVALVLVGAYWVYGLFNPPWRVRVHISNVPAGTHFVSLIADSGGKLRNMDWSPYSVTAIPFTMHPADCIWSYHHDRDSPKVDWNAFVRWQSGERYGVLTRDTGGTWRVSWFEAEAIPIRARMWLLGGGEATFDVAAGQTIPLLAEQVRYLDLDKVVENK